jgi:2-hydroxychromene-2-carboxylate isomerase
MKLRLSVGKEISLVQVSSLGAGCSHFLAVFAPPRRTFMRADHPVRFYFSFRSPYAWLAAERLDHELAGLHYALELVPIYPTAETFPNDPVRVPNKLRYVVLDTMRLAKAYGLPFRFGASLETDWAKAHAAFLGALSLGAGLRFMLAMFRARFGEARDVASDNVIAEQAERCALDATEILKAAHSNALQAQVSANFKLAQERDFIFGVPSFVYRGQLFWGHDRLGELRRELAEGSEREHEREGAQVS